MICSLFLPLSYLTLCVLGLELPLDLLVLLLGNVRLESLNELLNLHLLTSPHAQGSAARKLSRRNENIVGNVNDTILGDAVGNGNTSEGVDLDLLEWSVPRNVNSKAAAVQQRREVDVEVGVSLGLNILVALGGAVVEGVAVEGEVEYGVVLQESLEVLLAAVREEEGVDSGAKLAESIVGRSEEGATDMAILTSVVQKTSLSETEKKSGELGREELENLDGLWWWQDEGVDTVNDTVGSEDVDGDDTAVEIDGNAPQANLSGQTLRLATEGLLLEKGGEGLFVEDATSRVDAGNDVVSKDLADGLLVGLGSILRDLAEGVVCRSEDSEVGLGAVENLDELLILADQLSKLGGVLGLADELVDGVVWLAVVRRVVRATVARASVVRRTVVRVVRAMVRRVVVVTVMVVIVVLPSLSLED